MNVFGLDIGGSGIKGAPVDSATGAMVTERFRLPTPQPATPEAMIAAAVEVVQHFGWNGPIGCGFPAVVKQGVVHTAANIAPEWIGYDLGGTLAAALAPLGVTNVVALNDADAAGTAEMRYGAGRGEDGVVLMVTLGTGIGTALFVNGLLVPNTELGHIEIRGKEAEDRAADSVRERKELSWKEYARRVDEYLGVMQRLFWPDLIIVGGGVSKDADKFLSRLQTPARIVPAQMLNNAGIVGAALAAAPLTAAFAASTQLSAPPAEATSGEATPAPKPAARKRASRAQQSSEHAGPMPENPSPS